MPNTNRCARAIDDPALPSLFASKETLREAFVAGLERLLEEEDLGAYILVLANAAFDPAIHERLAPRLRQHFARLAERPPEAAPDDSAVFAALAEVGFNALEQTRRRRAGPWELQYNQLRSFRPPRNSGAVIERVQVDFDPKAFHFNKPFLRRETFWAGELLGRNVDLLYNKFPFAELHGLLVPERESSLPQFLRRMDHEFIWELTEQLGATLPGIGFGYNAYGAFSSVNHLHFQMFVRDEPLPVADARWLHNGGELPYPTACKRFDSAGDAWRFIDALHDANTAYNLLYLPGHLYCLPRRMQGSHHIAAWSPGFAWYETVGGFIVAEREYYETLQAVDIESELAWLAPRAEAATGCAASF